MSNENPGLCAQLAQLSPFDSSLLIWGDEHYDSELMAFYFHEVQLGLSDEQRHTLYCYPEMQINSEFEVSAMSFPPCASPYDGITDSLLIYDIGNLAHDQQAKLLKLIMNKQAGALNHFRFILLAKQTTQNLIPELRYYFKNYTFACQPLSVRKSDIIPLTNYILNKVFRPSGQPAPRLSLDAEGYLLAQPWFDGSLELVDSIEKAAEQFKAQRRQHPELEMLQKQHFNADVMEAYQLNELLEDSTA